MKPIVYELDIKIYLMKNINSNTSHQAISELIDKTLSRDEKYLNFHLDNIYKNYCFNNFYPMEKDYIFKEENIYSFKIRTVDEQLAKYLCEVLFNEYTDKIKVLGVVKKIIPIKHIDKLIAITPIIIKTENGYWRKNEKISDIEARIIKNIIRKYNKYYNTNLDENMDLFISLKFKNQKPIPSKYKDITLLGDKIEFKISNSQVAQELMYFALGTGLGEMNSRGFGYMNYLWIPKTN